MPYTIIIPARMESTRLANKPLLDVSGKPLIERVYDCACKSAAERIIIATDSPVIADNARKFATEVCITRSDHSSGTDRICEVVDQMDMAPNSIILNLQGDEPALPGKLLNKVAEVLIEDRHADLSTASHKMRNQEDFHSQSVVKVVTSVDNRALYFSRAPIPMHEVNGIQFGQHHIGIYAYRVEILRWFARTRSTPLEKTEKLEQLRFLEHGKKIAVTEVACPPESGVDTITDLQRMREYFRDKQ